MANGLLWSPTTFNITFFGLKLKLRTLYKCYIIKILHKSLPISLDNVKCPKILDFYIVKYAICTQKSDGGHKSNVNKPNGHTLLETPWIKFLGEGVPFWQRKRSKWMYSLSIVVLILGAFLASTKADQTPCMSQCEKSFNNSKVSYAKQHIFWNCASSRTFEIH